MTSSAKTDLLLGTLDLLVLKALDLGPLHGLGVTRRIQQATRGAFQVKPGSLFPALYRMEHAGWLVSSWDSRRRTGAPATTSSPLPADAVWLRKPNSGSGCPPR